MLARLPQIRENDKASCRKILAGLLEPLYADLGVTDLKGNSTCTALPAASSLINARGKHQARVIETHDFSAGTIRTDVSTGKTLLEFGYPVMDSPRPPRAVVIGAMNFSWVTRLAVERHLYPGATYTLINNSGTVLLRYPETDDWKGQADFRKTLVRTMASRDTEKSFEVSRRRRHTATLCLEPVEKHARRPNRLSRSSISRLSRPSTRRTAFWFAT